MITFTSKGDFAKTDSFLKSMMKLSLRDILEKNGKRGVAALSARTPVETGAAAGSWSYEVRTSGASAEIIWTNSEMAGGVPLVILLQYGHGTGTGGYVQGRDFINPAIKPIFDDIAKQVWKEVTSK